ncbi:MAG: hypothetical protein ABJF23_28360 [Bryobacteraceae bacterium]
MSYDLTFPHITRFLLRWTAIVLLAGLFMVNVYRAATQSLTIDEAFTYQLYLAKNLRAILTEYDANNHVLYTLLAKLSVGLFGNSELAIRLPSVLGGLVYFYATFRVCWFFFADRWLFLVGVAALTLNPFLLDFLSAGRGYGLGLALWMLGVWFLLEGRLERAGAAFGLAVAANLTLVFPCAAVILAYRRAWDVVDRLILPAVAASFIVLVIPLSYMKPGSFYTGSETLWRGVQTVVTLSLRHHMTVLPDLQILLLNVLFPVMLACTVALAWKPHPQLAWLGGALLLTLLLLVVAHYGGHLLYPELRTGLYLCPLFTLVYLLALRDRNVWWRLPLWLLVGLYALEWNTAHYAEWKFDAGTKRISAMLRDRHARRVGASWELEPALNYYRVRNRMDGMEPVLRNSPDGEYDYYVLLPSDYGVISRRRLKEVYRDPLSEVVLAAP